MAMLKINRPGEGEIFINLDKVETIHVVHRNDDTWWAMFQFAESREEFDLDIYPQLLASIPAIAVDYDHEEVTERNKQNEALQQKRAEQRAEFKAKAEAAKAAKKQEDA